MNILEFLENKILFICVKSIALFCRLFPLDDNKVLFISYMGNDISKDYDLIRKELSYNKNVKMVFLSRVFDNSLLNKISYFFFFLIQTFHIMTSKVVVLDGNNLVVSILNLRKETKVIQLWHAAGAIKKFGYNYKKRRYKVHNYDYIITPSSTMIKPFSDAFGVEEEKVLTIGIPQIDELFNDKIMNQYREEMYQKFPILKGKSIILYAPTYRGDGVFNKEEQYFDFEHFSKGLGDDYIVIYRPHPLLEERDFSNLDNVLTLANIDLNQLFSVVDILISDYSALIYNYLVLQRKIIFYAPDLERYIEDRGLYWDYLSYVPGKVVFNVRDLIEEVKSGEVQEAKLNEFYHNYYDFRDGRATKRVAELILNIIGKKLEGYNCG